MIKKMTSPTFPRYTAMEDGSDGFAGAANRSSPVLGQPPRTQIHRITRLQDIEVDYRDDHPPQRPPRTGHLHLWAVDLDQTHHTATRYQQYQWLSPREQKRLERYHEGDTRNRHAAAILALRIILGDYHNCPPDIFDYQFGSLGKPAAARDFENNRIFFNSTDCRNMALIAVASGIELGIDLEFLDRRLHSSHLVERICGNIENTQPPGHTPSEKQVLQCWTRKEAWGKALGIGIRYPLASIPVCMGLSWCNCRIFSTSGVWQMMTLQPEQPWLATVVAAGAIDQIQYRTWKCPGGYPVKPNTRTSR